jgi:hypothetical protein
LKEGTKILKEGTKEDVDERNEGVKEGRKE